MYTVSSHPGANGEIYTQLERKLRASSKIIHIHLLDNTVHIFVAELDKKLHQYVRYVFDSVGQDFNGDFELHNYFDRFELTVNDRRLFEKFVRSRIAQILDTDLLRGLESVRVVWDLPTRIWRSIGTNADGKCGKLCVFPNYYSEFIQYRDVLRTEFGIPFSVKVVSSKK